ncbi:MAG: hypothetical protein IIA87_05805 [Nanoarchaeota archaeon]|nr:hypothetical protein [Nanoarchaeota archaeon]
MRRNLLQRDRKGISLMIGYVLLIVIAIGLSIAVFAYLKLYLPRNQPQCPDDVSLTIEWVTCSGGNVELTLTNRGLFSVDGAYIRIGERGRIFKEILNEEKLRFVIVGGGGTIGLKPGESWVSPSYIYNGTGNQELEIEPLLFIEKYPVLCEKSIVSQIVDCG